MASCKYCGTHTGTHWPNCPEGQFYERGYTSQPTISRRSEEEKLAYLQGYEAALKSVEENDLETAKQTLAIVKEII